MDSGDAHTWNAAPERMNLAPAEVHVWLASLELPDDELSAFAATLDAAERHRAARYRFARDRRHFIAARGILRALLGAYLDASPASIAFAYGAHGKPALATSGEQPTLHFKVSHSETCALIAFAHDAEVGVDIEFMRPLDDMDALARAAFSPRERAALAALAGTHKHEAFYA
ncbi:MAG: 4'-phosphopantetheinyl transferase family protein, partial [Ktedonobacterales bacterium]